MLESLKPEKKVSAKRGPISAAQLERLLKSVNFVKPSYSENIPISGILKIVPRDFIIQYWQQPDIENSAHSTMYMDIGKAVHTVMQKALWHAGVIECPGCDEYKESKVYHPELHIKGYVDGLISPERLKAFDSELELPEWSNKLHCEIKTCGVDKLQELKTEEEISEEYKASATCYQKLLGTDTTCFIFVCRDNLRLKTLFYKGEDQYWEMAQNKARIIWKHVKNHTLPPPGLTEPKTGLDDPEIREQWIQEQKARQPERQFRDE